MRGASTAGECSLVLSKLGGGIMSDPCKDGHVLSACQCPECGGPARSTKHSLDMLVCTKHDRAMVGEWVPAISVKEHEATLQAQKEKHEAHILDVLLRAVSDEWGPIIFRVFLDNGWQVAPAYDEEKIKRFLEGGDDA